MKNKKLLIKIISILIIFTSCEKAEIEKEIYGTWNLFWAGGGLYPHDIDPNFSMLTINNDSNYYMYRNDSLKIHSQYKLYNLGYNETFKIEICEILFESVPNSESKIKFPFDKNLDVRIYSNDTLILSEKCPDCYQYFFKRKR